jgi:hypothetical protein
MGFAALVTGSQYRTHHIKSLLLTPQLPQQSPNDYYTHLTYHFKVESGSTAQACLPIGIKPSIEASGV